MKQNMALLRPIPLFSPTLYLLVLGAMLIAGCSGQPSRHTYGSTVGEREAILASAQRMLGVPYQYGGASPATGFDCSGLVQYAYEHAGIQVPRTTGGQYRASLLLPRNALQPGDVIFFRKRGIAKVSHVGIYLGKGRFIHAPSSGKRVTVADMNDPYWQRRYISGGRLF